MEEEKTVCSSNLCCGLFLFLFLMAVTGGDLQTVQICTVDSFLNLFSLHVNNP